VLTSFEFCERLVISELVFAISWDISDVTLDISAILWLISLIPVDA
jgi:hypothetical protein